MTKAATIIEAARTGTRPGEIARRHGIHVSTVYSTLKNARRRGLPIPRFQGTPPIGTAPVGIGQEVRFLICPDVAARLTAEAARRLTTPRQLVRDIFTAVVEDNLFDAVLDEAPDA